MKARRRPATVSTYSHWDELMASPSTPMPEEFRRHQLTRMWNGLASIERAQTSSGL